jgi:hypothetical protein
MSERRNNWKSMQPLAERRGIVRRRHPRVKVDLPVLCSQAGHADYRRAVDLSPGGMCLRSPLPYRVGMSVRLDFLLPGSDRSIVCGAEVRHVVPSRPPRMNLAFTTMDPLDKVRILEYLDRIEPAQSLELELDATDSLAG